LLLVKLFVVIMRGVSVSVIILIRVFGLFRVEVYRGFGV